MALKIIIPAKPMKTCLLNCGINGQCLKYENNDKYFCHCNNGWSGPQCNRRYDCNCSLDSVCIGPSICLCNLEKFGPRCYLDRNLCKSDSCANGGTCLSSDIRITEDKITCIC